MHERICSVMPTLPLPEVAGSPIIGGGTLGSTIDGIEHDTGLVIQTQEASIRIVVRNGSQILHEKLVDYIEMNEPGDGFWYLKVKA